MINAKTDPTGAGRALTQGCANISNCKWHTTSVTPAYGPPRILGDVLYNCSPKNEEMDMAETAVGVADERAQTTSLSEKVSLKLSLELVGLASTSVEFEAFSKQAVTFKTGVEVENAVVVPPGFKGYTTTQLLSANVTGDMVVGDNLIQVQNVDTAALPLLPPRRMPNSYSPKCSLWTMSRRARNFAQSCFVARAATTERVLTVGGTEPRGRARGARRAASHRAWRRHQRTRVRARWMASTANSRTEQDGSVNHGEVR